MFGERTPALRAEIIRRGIIRPAFCAAHRSTNSGKRLTRFLYQALPQSHAAEDRDAAVQRDILFVDAYPAFPCQFAANVSL